MLNNREERLFNLEYIKNSAIYFTCSREGKFVFILYSGEGLGQEEYKTTMVVTTGVIYFISQFSLLYEENIKISIFSLDKDFIEDAHIDKEEIFKQQNHIINKVGVDKYDRIKQYVNGTYGEFFIEEQENNYCLNRLDKEFLNSCKNVIDIGSNAGFFGLYLSQFAILDKYICVEPNSQLNKVNSIINDSTSNYFKIYENLFYSESGKKLDFYLPEEARNWAEGSSSINKRVETKIAFKTDEEKDSIDLNTIISENNIDEVDLLKIDTEGAEIYLIDNEDNVNFIKEKVKVLLVEVHSTEIRDEFFSIFDGDFEIIEKDFDLVIHPIQMINKKFNSSISESSKEKAEDMIKPSNKKILLKVSCVALGDTLCSTPTIKKVSDCYGSKVYVQTFQPDLFKNNPYIEKVYSYNDNIDDSQFDEIFETYNQWIKTNKGLSSDCFDRVIELKLSTFEARQIHALGVGISLYPEDMSCIYIPDAQTERSMKIDKDFLVFHVTESWPNRTWPSENWQRLVDLIKEHTDFKIVTIGKEHKEMTSKGEISKRAVKLKNIDLDYCIRNDKLKFQENEKMEYDTISEMWHIINNGFGLVIFDSGPVHVAGTTDSHIIWMSASVRPEKTAPYRNGCQDYKFHVVNGTCQKYCASEPMYSVKEWGTINSMPYYPLCQEGYDGFPCQPTPDQVFFKICEIYESEKNESRNS